MKYQIGDNLEVLQVGEESYRVQCVKCGGELGSSPATWYEQAKVRMLPAGAASPLMAILDSQYRLKQLLCPSCGALLHTELVGAERQPVA
jgi:hypothetical protein